MTEVETATLWQIGKPGGGGKEFPQSGGWQAEFTYTVGSDADPINKPNMPPVLVKAGLKPKLHCTKKLNIRFTLDRNYGDKELNFYYDFLGAETDSIFLNGKKFKQIKGAGEGKLKQNQIPLPALSQGENVLSITTAGGADGAHWIDYLKLESRVTLNKQGTAGSDIQGKDFDIQPRQGATQSKIKRLMVRAAWAVDALQVEYENLATQPPQLYQSATAGKSGDDYKEFSIEAGDYLTQVSGTWGQQSPNHPKEAIISLEFKTLNGVTSGVFGGESPRKQVEPFAFTAPNGYAISGFFGATGRKDILARLGIYLQPIEELSAAQPGSTQSGATATSSESVTEVATSSSNGDRQDNITTSTEKGMGAQLAAASSINTHVPAPGARTSSGTGLEDYAYWLHEIAKQQAAKAGQEKKPFRRGRIWA